MLLQFSKKNEGKSNYNTFLFVFFVLYYFLRKIKKEIIMNRYEVTKKARITWHFRKFVFIAYQRKYWFSFQFTSYDSR